MASPQNYNRIYDYVHEYQELLYDYYAEHAPRFLTTYYNMNFEETVWDDDQIMGGAYQPTGELSGIRRNKILLLPIYFPDEITTLFEGSEEGYQKNTETSIVIPCKHGFIPYPNDIIKFEQDYLSYVNDTYPLYRVTGIEIHPNTNKRFWKLKLRVFQSLTTEAVDEQVINTYSFVEYNKQIHWLEDAQFISKLLYKSSLLGDALNHKLFDQRTGFYYPER